MRRSTLRGTSARVATDTRTDRARLNDSLELLHSATLEIVGRLADASNATFLCDLRVAGAATDAVETGEHPAGQRAIYKPIRGERPLDDFPDRTLAKRELAAFELSEASRWRIVPPTVLRDGPFGRGMVQLWIEVDRRVDVVELVVKDDDRLRSMCVFDIVANNADRKGSHILPTKDGHFYGVDHGICFAAEPKLRTVLWNWRGLPLTSEELTVVRRVCEDLGSGLGSRLARFLSPAEVRATELRAESLLTSGRFPQPDPHRPAVPWPPF